MAPADASSTKQRCAVHPDRMSVGSCQECGRPACLGCAIPFRGLLLCSTCASRALGAPEVQEPAPASPWGRVDVVAGIALAVGLLATIPSWHRAGSLSGTLSAWLPSSELPVFVAALALAGAGVLTLRALVLRRTGRGPSAAAAALSALAVGCIGFSLLRAPDFYAFTPAPFVALAAAVVAAVMFVIRAWWLSPTGRNLPARSRA